jgi:hypothetical protein
MKLFVKLIIRQDGVTQSRGQTSTFPQHQQVGTPYTIYQNGAPFQFSETYSGPGMIKDTTVIRSTTIMSVTDTTSVVSSHNSIRPCSHCLCDPCICGRRLLITAVANPQATSTGSVTNQAVQVLQGPYVTNSYGGGVSCQGPTFNLTPFYTTTHSGQRPYEEYANIDNDPTTPLERTGQKDNFSGTLVSLGPSQYP